MVSSLSDYLLTTCFGNSSIKFCSKLIICRLTQYVIKNIEFYTITACNSELILMIIKKELKVATWKVLT